MAPVHRSWGVGSVLVLLFLAGLTGAAAVSLTQLKPADAVISADPARQLGSQVDAQTKIRPDRDRGLPSDLHRDPAFFAETGVAGLSCARCHNDFKLIVVSELGGDFTIDDCAGGMGRQCAGLFTDGYTPGQTYQMRAIIAYPGMSSWGFDLWVRDENGATAGTLTGQRFRSATHTRTQDGMLVGAVGNEGVGFRQNGRLDGPVGWRFTWRAPATDIGPVRFFAEGTAANRDRTPRGDYSYYLDGIVVNPAATK
jgi:hypothetical protein